MSRRDRLHASVHRQIGANKLHQRWILPYREGRDVVSVEGLAEAPRTITISPIALVETIIHECLHQEYPSWSEPTIERATTFLFQRMTDDECRAVYDAYAAKVKILSSPTPSE